MARAVWARGIFPHQFAWLLNNPLRRLIISPEQLAAASFRNGSSGAGGTTRPFCGVLNAP